MEKTTCIIVDDEPDAREALEILLQDILQIQLLAQFDSVNPAIDFIVSSRPAIVFLDIDMPGKSGFDFIAELKDHHLSPSIIFTTAHSEYAIEAIEEAAFGYLLKPIDPEKLRKVINRFRCLKQKFVSTTKSAKIKFNTRNGFELIDQEDIVYFIAEGSYTEVFTVNATSFLVSQNLGSIEDRLSSDSFFRISRSCIIGLAYLKKVKRSNHSCIIDINGKEITFNSTARRIASLEKLFK